MADPALFAQAVFQPAEERGTGAQAMIDDGLFKRFPKPDMVLGQHVMPMSADTPNSLTLRPGHPSHSGDRRAGVSRCRASLAVGVRHRPAGN